MRRDWDVVVVGAGPAGATAAWELSKDGARVLLLDKAVFPRHKCCGGGLTVKAASLLGDGIEGLLERSISGASLGFAGADHFVGEHDGPVMYTVNRERFDHFLLERAERAGAHVIQGLSARAVNPTSGGVEVVTDSLSIRSAFVVGADGSRGVISRSFHQGTRDNVVGIETEVLVSDRDLYRWKSRAMVALGWISNGYAWVFPKADHLSVGIASLRGRGMDVKRAYREFVRSLELERSVIDRWSGDIIPLCVGNPVVSLGRVATVGDAAGLADPLTGEGLYHAILSGRLAARAIAEALHHELPDLQAYQQSIDEEIAPEIKAARTFARILGLMPRRLLDLIRADDRVWRAGCALISGQTTYVAIRERITSLGGLYSLLKRK